MAAWINGLLGLGLSFGAGIGILGWDWAQVLRCVLSSAIGGFIALTATLRAERSPWIRRHVLKSSGRTWVFALSSYFGLMVLGAPDLQDLRAFGILILPLILCTGFTILVFGPMQDRRVAREQNKARRNDSGIQC
jgi:hypothetical protein